MVVAEEVEEAVEEEDGDLLFDGVAGSGGLFEGAGDADGHFAEGAGGVRSGETEDVGGSVFAEEIAIQLAKVAVGGQQGGEGCAGGDFGLEAKGEIAEPGPVEPGGPGLKEKQGV
jgi:hypothetical protein